MKDETPENIKTFKQLREALVYLNWDEPLVYQLIARNEVNRAESRIEQSLKEIKYLERESSRLNRNTQGLKRIIIQAQYELDQIQLIAKEKKNLIQSYRVSIHNWKEEISEWKNWAKQFR